MEAWRQGEQHWLEPELEQQREEQNSGYETQDPLFPRLAQYARAKHAFTVADFLEEQEVPASQWAPMATKVGMMMARIGTHRRVERKIDGSKVRRYEIIHEPA
jgi:hypothetical protein